MNTSTSGKLKAIYLLWLFLNLMLLVPSPSPFGKRETLDNGKIDYATGRNYGEFYPRWGWGLGFDHTEEYDITEFVFYASAPLVLWYAVRLWRSGGDKK